MRHDLRAVLFARSPWRSRYQTRDPRAPTAKAEGRARATRPRRREAEERVGHHDEHLPPPKTERMASSAPMVPPIRQRDDLARQLTRRAERHATFGSSSPINQGGADRSREVVIRPCASAPDKPPPRRKNERVPRISLRLDRAWGRPRVPAAAGVLPSTRTGTMPMSAACLAVGSSHFPGDATSAIAVMPQVTAARSRAGCPSKRHGYFGEDRLALDRRHSGVSGSQVSLAETGLTSRERRCAAGHPHAVTDAPSLFWHRMVPHEKSPDLAARPLS